MSKFVWYSDTHLNLSPVPFIKKQFIKNLNSAKADGIFITGDISSGPYIESDLSFLASKFNGPIYFVLGNHDYHKRYIDSVHSDIKRLCNKFNNLHWLTQECPIQISEEVFLIGTEGWYDGTVGNPDLLKFTTDWFLTYDFFDLKDMQERISVWQKTCIESTETIKEKLSIALKECKTVYILTHFPPWPEATRAQGTMLEKFWLPYSTNTYLGKGIEKVMEGRKKKKVVVLCGHTHSPCHIRVTNNIECMVSRASYFGRVNPEQTIII